MGDDPTRAALRLEVFAPRPGADARDGRTGRRREGSTEERKTDVEQEGEQTKDEGGSRQV